MDKETLQMIMDAMQDKGEYESKVLIVRNFCRNEQRKFAEDAKRHDFKFDKNLIDCTVKARDILALLDWQDDPVALGIFAKHEQKILEEQCTATIAKDHIETTPNTEDDEDE